MLKVLRNLMPTQNIYIDECIEDASREHFQKHADAVELDAAEADDAELRC